MADEGEYLAVENDRGPKTQELVTKVAEHIHSNRDPVIVHVVNNAVRGDSRVIKSAQYSTSLGFPTLILGITNQNQAEVVPVDGVTALLVPVPMRSDLARASKTWAHHTRWIRALRIGKRIRSMLRSQAGPSVRQREQATPEWARLQPPYLAMNDAFASALTELAPDIIHVHDTVPLPAAIAHAARTRMHGKNCRVLYDSHECNPEMAKSFRRTPHVRSRLLIERAYIRDADLVITVSRKIARLLKSQYGLKAMPRVVTNAPTATRDANAPDLRTAIGLPMDVPLGVYAGGIANERGLDTILQAMPDVPTLHLAVVTNTSKPVVARVTRLARMLKVEDRVHFTDYVLPSQVTQYLSSADIGLIPRKSGGHLDLSLPTKYREYLHAGLPLVVSDNKAMAREVNATGVGEVFPADKPKDLAAALERILADPDRYRSAITPRLLERYSWERQQKVLKKCYLSLAPRGPRNNPGARNALIEGPLEEDSPKAVPEFTPFTAETPRFAGASLAIGGAHTLGLAFWWAEAANARLKVPSVSFGPTSKAFHAPHRNTARECDELLRNTNNLRWVVDQHSHVLVDGFTRLFGDLLGNSVEDELPILWHNGLEVGFIAYGSELRDPRRIGNDGFDPVSADHFAYLDMNAALNRDLAQRFEGKVYVATPDLLIDAPEAVWLPITVDLAQWNRAPTLTGRSRPRVLHLGSRSESPYSGSEAIIPVLEDMHQRGLIEHLADPGLVSDRVLAEHVYNADIIVEQLRVPTYGLAAIEAMAAGRVVVGYVGEEVRALVTKRIPIVDSTVHDLEKTLVDLAHDSDRQISLGAAGKDFVATAHSAMVAAEVLAGFLANRPS